MDIQSDWRPARSPLSGCRYRHCRPGTSGRRLCSPCYIRPAPLNNFLPEPVEKHKYRDEKRLFLPVSYAKMVKTVF